MTPKEAWKKFTHVRPPAAARADRLRRACLLGDTDLFLSSLPDADDAGFDVRQLDALLPLAAAAGHLDIVKALVAAGAGLESKAGEMLLAAARHGYARVAGYLLVTVENLPVIAALELAAAGGNANVVDTVLSLCNIAPDDLFALARRRALAGDAAFVAQAARHGLDVRRDGDALLCEVCTAAAKSVDVAGVLLSFGADPNARSATPLARALENKNFALAQRLIDTGANPLLLAPESWDARDALPIAARLLLAQAIEKTVAFHAALFTQLDIAAAAPDEMLRHAALGRVLPDMVTALRDRGRLGVLTADLLLSPLAGGLDALELACRGAGGLSALLSLPVWQGRAGEAARLLAALRPPLRRGEEGRAVVQQWANRDLSDRNRRALLARRGRGFDAG